MFILLFQIVLLSLKVCRPQTSCSDKEGAVLVKKCAEGPQMGSDTLTDHSWAEGRCRASPCNRTRFYSVQSQCLRVRHD